MTRPAKPSALAPIFDNIPEALRAIPRWICWRHAWHKKREKWIKLPVCSADPKTPASASDPATWGTFEEARTTYEVIGGVDGIGFVFNGDGIIGGDFDKCMDPATGEMTGVAVDAVKRLAAYWELSPSGKGLHFIARGDIPKAFKSDAKGIELYKTGRYFTITGRVLDGGVGGFPEEPVDLQWLIDEHFARPEVLANAKFPVEHSGETDGEGANFFKRVNDAAMERLGEWVPTLFPDAKPYNGGFRIASAQLGRNLEEDISIVPSGIVDFGVHDMGDEREGKRTPIDLVMEWYAQQLAGGDVLETPDARRAAMWLCERLNTDPADLGWSPPAKAQAEMGGLPFDLDDNDRIIANIANLVLALGSEEYCGCRIGFDTFRDEVMLARKGTDEWRAFLDADYVRLRLLLEMKGFKAIGRELIRDVVGLIADDAKFDSAILWLQSIQWDGVERIERFLPEYMNAEDSEYTRAVGLYLWTAMAGRVLEPGIKADMVPILVGEQGMRKTSGVAAMVVSPEHFVEVDLAERDVELARKMRGRLIGEIGELRGLQNRELESIKTFITRTHESWTPKWKEFAITYPRRLVFIGTTNAEEFLADETGNRRWLPVRVGRVELERIRADRLQLWAEAAALFTVGGVAYQRAEELAPQVHGAHSVGDVWQENIERWLDGGAEDDLGGPAEPRRGKPFTTVDVLVGALSMDLRQVGKRDEMRVARILKGLGFSPTRIRIGKKLQRVWAIV